MLLSELVSVSNEVARTSARSEKTALLAALLVRLTAEEAPVAVSYLSGSPVQRKLGVGYATLNDVEAIPAGEPSLELLEVHGVLDQLAGTAGPGSKAKRGSLLAHLLGKATVDEQAFLEGLILRNLRQGALEGVMSDAVADALGQPVEKVRRAAMLEGDLATVAARALADGAAALTSASIVVFTPLQPMLAGSAETAGEAVAGIGEAIVEAKLDGLRLQVHRDGLDVRVFTRNLRDVTAGMTGVVDAALGLDARRFILDGEGLAVDDAGRPRSFQDSMSKPANGRVDPLVAFFFDVLHVDGSDLVDEPLSERRDALLRLVPADQRVESIVTADPQRAEEFFVETLDAGFEGVVVKDPDRTYEAGRRGSGWLKVKPTHTLDLVVLAAEWGSGRRQGWLSNLHLGARDAEGGFVMLGKTFKGLTDEMLEWQTRTFLELETRRQGHVVFIEPSVVYEIAFDGVQRSTRYPGGVTLRFARVKGYRDDKDPAEADTLETVKSYLR